MVLTHQFPTAQPLLDMVAATDTSVAALPDLASYISALDPVVSAWGALPANKASVLDTATQAITDLNDQATQAWFRPYSFRVQILFVEYSKCASFKC